MISGRRAGGAERGLDLHLAAAGPDAVAAHQPRYPVPADVVVAGEQLAVHPG